MGCSIRHATPDDAPIIHRFIYELAAFQGLASHVEVSSERLRSQMEAISPPFECLLAEQDEEPVGFALFYPTYSTFTGRQGMHLVDLYVLPELRQCGIGRTLFSVLVDIARHRNYARIDWEVFRGNAQAERFYSALGAKRLDEWSSWRLNSASIDAPKAEPCCLVKT